MISDKEKQELLEASPAERVTEEYMKSRIIHYNFYHVGNMTICNIVLDNGYQVIGQSACVNPENYKEEVGDKIAYDDAFSNLWPLFGFLLAEKTHLLQGLDRTVKEVVRTMPADGA